MFTVSMWTCFLSECQLAISLHSNQGLTGTENNLKDRDKVMSCVGIRLLLLSWVVVLFLSYLILSFLNGHGCIILPLASFSILFKGNMLV